LASDARYSPGHYRRPGATLVARSVYEKITTLPAFDAFVQQISKHQIPSTKR
jgi:hypothetical protein